jgi:hypothetical protein
MRAELPLGLLYPGRRTVTDAPAARVLVSAATPAALPVGDPP